AAAAGALRPLLPAGYAPEILTGREGYARLAALSGAHAVLSAQVGAAGLTGTLAAALAGKMICLANKESLVLAGGLLRAICAGTGAAILPVDSEHNALFQCLAGRGQEARTLVLTASGGPFRGRSADELRRVTPEAALAHPNWRMGAKISIDSATMMNKGLELIEAVHLYGVAPERIRILVHPQSVVHSLAEFADGSFLAQLGAADMRLAIGHCLNWPRCEPAGAPSLDLVAVGSLTFEEPDPAVFPCLRLAREALAADRAAPAPSGFGPACVALNAANEAAVELFLNGGCGFMDIPDLVEAALAALPHLPEAARGARDSGLSSSGGLPDGPLDEARAARLALELAGRVDALDGACRALVRRRAAHSQEPTC
ncbi:1-deoxy-D-xylulose-5-phosphate reductoisomerase, partial [uncultured Desulfovibrio sp.]|uniref:1-deoxy-D-xylulose-5-phosphate reductoisomerase n=1 Tax=uncultured Desulfovibrio sp. TaxID=167968 RepID=UPI0028051757